MDIFSAKDDMIFDYTYGKAFEIMISTYYKSPIGYLRLTAEEDGLTEINFISDDIIIIEKRVKNSILSLTIEQLDEYFVGNRTIFTVPIRMEGTDFQKSVWQELIKIPFGETRSYKNIAQEIGNENASRAVGNANNKNKIPIIIPCHRVVGTNNKLVGYAGKLWRKEVLLKHESNKVI